MNYSELFDEFVNEVKAEGTFASKEEIAEVAYKMLDVLKKNKDATPEEYVEAVIADDIAEMERIREKALLPGYTMGISVGNINVKYFGGSMDAFETEMKPDTMFDISSMTKMYTQVVLFNLIKEGKIRLDDKIGDLDYRFMNIKDVSIRELSEFTIEFQTPGNITLMEDSDRAKEALYNIKIAEYDDGNLKRGRYYYTDFGMMILKEVMEQVTSKSYPELVDQYITDKLGLNNTKIIVPTGQYDLLTGSPNVKYGAVNDPKANAVGGYSGHAGVFASSDDLIKLGKGIADGTLLSDDDYQKAITVGAKHNRGVMGNAYVATPDGIKSSYVDPVANNTDFAIQGSTRTQLNIGKNSVSTILLNPSSLSIEKALKKEAEINEQKAMKGERPISIVKHYGFNRDGKMCEYDMVDARYLFPIAQADPLTALNAKTSLRLRFLSKAISAYDKSYDKEINVSKKV